MEDHLVPDEQPEDAWIPNNQELDDVWAPNNPEERLIPHPPAEAPPPLITFCPSLKRLCLDVLLQNPQLKIPELPVDIEEALFHRAMFPACILGGSEMPKRSTECVSMHVYVVLRSWNDNQLGWVTYMIQYMSRFLGGARVTRSDVRVNSVALLTGSHLVLP